MTFALFLCPKIIMMMMISNWRYGNSPDDKKCINLIYIAFSITSFTIVTLKAKIKYETHIVNTLWTVVASCLDRNVLILVKVDTRVTATKQLTVFHITQIIIQPFLTRENARQNDNEQPPWAILTTKLTVQLLQKLTKLFTNWVQNLC